MKELSFKLAALVFIVVRDFIPCLIFIGVTVYNQFLPKASIRSLSVPRICSATIRKLIVFLVAGLFIEVMDMNKGNEIIHQKLPHSNMVIDSSSLTIAKNARSWATITICRI